MSSMAVLVIGMMYLADRTVLTMVDIDAADSDVSSLLVFAQEDAEVETTSITRTTSVLKYSNGYIEYYNDEKMCNR